MSDTAESAGRIVPKAVVLLVGFAAFVVVLGGLRAASSIVAQVFLALVLTIAVYPSQRYAIARGWPRWAAFLVGAALATVIFLGIAVAIVLALARFGTLVDQYAQEINDHVGSLTDQLHHLGVASSQQQAVSDSLDPGRLAGFIADTLATVAGLASNVFFILTLLLFMALDAYRFPALMQQAAGDRPVVKALNGFAHSTRVYLVVSTIFGFIVAVLDSLALALLGVPGALAWGVLAFVTNYVPNIGFVIGLIPPALLGFLDGGFSTMIAVIVAYSLINFVIQSLIQPKFVADAVGLSPTITIISLLFWAWALGAIGALLAIPLSLLTRALLIDADPDNAWLRPIVAGDNRASVRPPPEEHTSSAVDDDEVSQLG